MEEGVNDIDLFAKFLLRREENMLIFDIQSAWNLHGAHGNLILTKVDYFFGRCCSM